MPEDNHENQQNYKQKGFQAASSANGSFQSFKIQIRALYHNLASKDIDATNEKHKNKIMFSYLIFYIIRFKIYFYF